MNPLSPSAWLKTSNGQLYYAYAGTKAAASTSDEMVNIGNVGLDDLLVRLTCAVDWQQIVATCGFSVSIDGTVIFFHNNNVAGGIKIESPWHFEFVVPRQTNLVVTSFVDGASVGAFRSVMLTASPIGSQ